MTIKYVDLFFITAYCEVECDGGSVFVVLECKICFVFDFPHKWSPIVYFFGVVNQTRSLFRHSWCHLFVSRWFSNRFIWNLRQKISLLFFVM